MIVNEDQRGGPDVQRLADHLARVNRRLVNRTVTDVMIQHQPVLRVEIEHPHPFHRKMRHVDGQIIEQRLPTAQHGFLCNFAARHAPRGQRHDLERGRARLAHAVDIAQRAGIGVQDGGKRAETFQQRLGDRFGIAPRLRGKQQIFQDLVVRQGFCPAIQQPLAQTRAMARAIMGLLACRQTGQFVLRSLVHLLCIAFVQAQAQV